MTGGGQAGFPRFWVAATVSDFGTAVTTLALQVLVVVTLDGSTTEVGLVSAARWLPYLLLGVLVGVLVDRVRRRPVLVATDLGRAVVLTLIPALALLDVLTIPVLVASVAVLGLLTATIRVREPARDLTGPVPSIVRELREGLSWVYRHATLMPLAVSTHAWFLFFSVLSTVYAPFALRAVGLSPFGLGLTLALAGAGGLVGAGLSTRIAARAGIVPTVVGSRLAEAAGFAAVAPAPAATGGPQWVGWALLGAGQLLVGF